MDFYSNRGDLVECVRFVCAGANPITVETSLRGATVSRTGVGNYTVTFAGGVAIDHNNRGVSFGTLDAGFAHAQERAAGSDTTVDVLVTDAAGAAADSGTITVKVHRTEIG